MTEWIVKNIGTIAAALVVLVVVGLNVLSIIKRKKKGGHIIDCGGNCASCGGSCASKPPAGYDGPGLIKTVLGIDGMMCGMCESHVNDCIRNNFDVRNVYSSHKKGETVIISKDPLDEDRVRKSVEESGYRVISFQSGQLQ